MANETKKLSFPKDFLWGAATSAHQTEGENKNSDWWRWEQAGGGREPSGLACDSYRRYEEDFVLAKEFGHNAHRLSLEWARIEPKRGQFSKEATAHYRKVLASLKNKNIKTFVTLHHFTNPLWFAELGGWENGLSPRYFAGYAAYCARNFSDLTDFFITINEPLIYLDESYVKGEWPPQKKNFLKALKVLLNLSSGHRRAYEAIKKYSERPIGPVNNISPLKRAGNNPMDWLVCRVYNKIVTDLFLCLCRGKYDFLGVNYYLEANLKNLKISFDYRYGKTDFKNWPVAPEGIYGVLRDLEKYGRPIYITENGCADSGDRVRKVLIREILKNVHRAISDGVDVRGYLHWSLIDNFEWDSGFDPRFGLIGIDRRDNLKRIPRKSAFYYSKICRTNELEIK
jgi:beta-glucosidase